MENSQLLLLLVAVLKIFSFWNYEVLGQMSVTNKYFQKNVCSNLWHSLNWLGVHCTCIAVIIFHIAGALTL